MHGKVLEMTVSGTKKTLQNHELKKVMIVRLAFRRETQNINNFGDSEVVLRLIFLMFRNTENLTEIFLVPTRQNSVNKTSVEPFNNKGFSS